MDKLYPIVRRVRRPLLPEDVTPRSPQPSAAEVTAPKETAPLPEMEASREREDADAG